MVPATDGDEAHRAVVDATHKLEAGYLRWPEVRTMSRRFDEALEDNHFSERLDSLFGR